MEKTKMKPLGRIALRNRLIGEIYNEYFKNGGEKVTLSYPKEEIEIKLAMIYLMDKGYITLSILGMEPENYQYKIELLHEGIDYNESLLKQSGIGFS